MIFEVIKNKKKTKEHTKHRNTNKPTKERLTTTVNTIAILP